jgi:transposase InsO family protein
MKLDNPPFMPKKPARQMTRLNEAWAVDFMVLDCAHRPLVMLVVDVGTRRALSATVSLAIAEDVVATLERLVRRSGRPQEIWVDDGRGYRFHPVRVWSERHGITVTYGPSPRSKAVAERPLHHLRAHLHDKSFATLTELGHDIERWRQAYTAGIRTEP